MEFEQVVIWFVCFVLVMWFQYITAVVSCFQNIMSIFPILFTWGTSRSLQCDINNVTSFHIAFSSTLLYLNYDFTIDHVDERQVLDFR